MRMKYALPAILILSVLGSAAFGLALMDHKDGGHEGCFAATAQGALCPSALTDFINFHSTAYKSLSDAFFTASILALIGLLALAFAGPGRFREMLGLPAPRLFAFARQGDTSNYLSLDRSLLRFISLKERGDSTVLA